MKNYMMMLVVLAATVVGCSKPVQDKPVDKPVVEEELRGPAAVQACRETGKFCNNACMFVESHAMLTPKGWKDVSEEDIDKTCGVACRGGDSFSCESAKRTHEYVENSKTIAKANSFLNK